MTTTTIYSSPAEGVVKSADAVWATAAAGAALTVIDNTELDIGGSTVGGNKTLTEAFTVFDTSGIDDGATISAAVLSMNLKQDSSVTNFDVVAKLFDWSSGGLTTADWRTPAQLSALTTLATWSTVGSPTVDAYHAFTNSGSALVDAINKTGPTYFMLASGQLISDTPYTTDERVVFHSSGAAGTTKDPKLVITHTGGPLFFVGGRTQAFVGGTSDQSASLTGLTGGIGNSPDPGDFVIVGLGVGSQGADRDLVIGSGDYTEIVDLYADGTTYDANLAVATKFMGGTPDTTVNIGSSGADTDARVVAVEVWRGVDPTTPMDVTPTTATGTGTGRPNPSAITPATAGARIVAIGVGAAASGGTLTQSGSELSNFQALNSADTNDATIGIGYKEWTSGAFDPVAWTGGSNNAANSWAAVTLALRPVGDTSAPVGLATETDTALPLGYSRPVGLATTTNTAFALGSSRPVGLATETDTALALGSTHPVGLATETDAALPLGSARPVGLATETDTAFSLASPLTHVTLSFYTATENKNAASSLTAQGEVENLGDVVGTIIGAHAEAVLSLVITAGGRFILDPAGPYIRIHAPLNYEVNASHDITIRQTLGAYVLDTTITITVTNWTETGSTPSPGKWLYYHFVLRTDHDTHRPGDTNWFQSVELINTVDGTGDTITEMPTGVGIKFNSGGPFQPLVGQNIVGATSGAEGEVQAINVQTGSWETEDAAGTLALINRVGTFDVTETFDVEGLATNVGTVIENSESGMNLNAPVYVYRVHFTDSAHYIDLHVDNLYGSEAAAEVAVDKYTGPLGLLPRVLRDNLRLIKCVQADGDFSAEDLGHFFVVYGERADIRIEQEKLEELFFHEAVHASIQKYSPTYSLGLPLLYSSNGPPPVINPAWAAAVAADDDRYLSEYGERSVAFGSPDEDFAESAHVTHAITLYPERFEPVEYAAIMAHIPNRIAFFQNVFFPPRIKPRHSFWLQ